jgi:hypothetical protein
MDLLDSDAGRLKFEAYTSATWSALSATQTVRCRCTTTALGCCCLVSARVLSRWPH